MKRARVDIGDTSLDAAIAGSGPVTVVFENGLGTPIEEWDAVVPAIAAKARTLCYDRRRAPAAGSLVMRTAADMVADLEKLLAALSVSPPYVLVGHSWGGVVARVFAHRHPSKVAGLVFVDATHEVMDSRGMALMPVMYSVMGLLSRTGPGRRWLFRLLCPPGAPAAYAQRLERQLADPARWRVGLRTARAEGAGIRPSLAALRSDCPDLPPVPISVLTAGGVAGPNVKSIQRVHEAWQAAVSRTPSARYTNIPGSGHQLPMEAPQVVIDAINSVLAAVKA